MNFIPYKANECLENTFYQIPETFSIVSIFISNPL